MNSESSTTEAEHTHAAKSRLYPAFLILEGKLCAVAEADALQLAKSTHF